MNSENEKPLTISEALKVEGAKIKCGEKHFEEVASGIEAPARYIKATDVDEMMGYI